MQYKQLGKTGLQVSSLCLGTVNFGWMTTEQESCAIMDRALATGLNFFDTANSYNYQNGDDSTESIIGRWLHSSRQREKVVLATKVYGTLGPWPNEGKLSAYHIKRACEASLKRLQTDYIDLYQMHHVDRTTPWEEIWQAMDQLVREGKILYVGSCNFAGWHIVAASCVSRRRGSLGLVSEQSVYNLTKRQVELEVIPACQSYGLGFLPYSPLAGGLLAGAVERASEGRRALQETRQIHRTVLDQLAQFLELCDHLHKKPAEVALAWLLHQPGVTAPIIGPRTTEQLNQNLRALDLKLTTEILTKLDQIWTGPGGAAPEAYAW
jgi:aryl-alcohol dehydrogenase-like predicted oxidoreductase